MRRKKLLLNTVSSLGYQIISLICGFILPRIILNAFGSQVNGLATSITRFLQIIAFMDLGVGAVVQSSYYKPLAVNDTDEVSRIYASCDRFFRRLSLILLVYVIVLIAVFPNLIAKDFSFLYSATLIAAISVSFFAQYFFGMSNKLLLYADQRGYIEYTAHAVTVILNTVASAILVHFGASIQIVRMSTSVIFLLRPLAIRLYVQRHYEIKRNIQYTGEPIKQKWNGLAQHVASVVLDDTDTVVLSLFSTLSNVSIYSVYHLVVYGVRNLFTVATNGIQSMWGEMWAKGENESLKHSFSFFEWLIHMGCVFIFGCMGMLILPFVQVYTKGINDANYLVPSFAYLITAAYGVHCMRLPYHILIKAVGHYQETQSNYIIAAAMNLGISIAAVKFWGLVGVAIGTLAAMAYQTIWMVRYDSKHILLRNVQDILKLCVCDIAIIVFSVLASRPFSLSTVSYGAWIVLAIKTAAIWLVGECFINFLFYRHHVMRVIQVIKGRVKH